jgi:hypothetical protein
MERFRSAALSGLAVLGCLVAAGCAGPAGPAPAGRPHPVGAASAQASPAPSRPDRRAALPISGPCKTSALSVSASGHRTRSGLEVERFLATDVSGQACSLTGAPRLTPYGPLSSSPGATSDLAVSQQEFDGDDRGGAAAGPVDLQPGQAAAFDVAWYAASPVVCEHASGFGFSAPGDDGWSDMRQVGYPFGPMCDGLFYVSTVRPPSR